MIRSAKDLSPDQKTVLESLLGRRILADEAISVRVIEIAVGIPVARYPPHRPVRALTSAYGSYLGWVAAKRALG